MSCPRPRSNLNTALAGRTPEVPRSDSWRWAPALALDANAALQVAITGADEVLGVLKRDGSLARIGDRLASFEERQRILRKDHFDALERRDRKPSSRPRPMCPVDNGFRGADATGRKP